MLKRKFKILNWNFPLTKRWSAFSTSYPDQQNSRRGKEFSKIAINYTEVDRITISR
jgi:hypothetical protein